MVQVVLPSGGTVNYAYDHEGKRISKTAGGTTIDYYFDGEDVIIESQGASIVAYYTQGQGLISQRRGNASHFYHYDGLGSTKALTDANQNIQASYKYDAWGNVLQTSGTITNPYLYVGKSGYYGEANVGMYLLTQRWFCQPNGRFVTKDILSGVNAYVYVSNNPVRVTKPYGSTRKDKKREKWEKIFKEACKALCEAYIGKEWGWIGQKTCDFFCEALKEWAKTTKEFCKWVKYIKKHHDLCAVAASRYNFCYENCYMFCIHPSTCADCCLAVTENLGYGGAYEFYDPYWECVDTCNQKGLSVIPTIK